MADVTNGGVKRTDEGIVYVFGIGGTAAPPSGAVRAKGALPRTRAQVVTKDAQIVVSYV